MQRIKELTRDYRGGYLTARAFRSALIAQLSMMDDETTEMLVVVLERTKK